MLPIHKVIACEALSRTRPSRQNEPFEAMDNPEQVDAYVRAYEWGGPTSALQLHHLRELSRMIRAGDVVLDLACGPGPLLLELAGLYPDVQFIGADLSATMLQRLDKQAIADGLRNISVLHEDIRHLPSLRDARVDLIISTSALHHLPDQESLRQVFQLTRSLLQPGGGYYMFDFGLLKSAETRRLLVAEVARLAPPITARDYDLSLQAAFPIDDVLHLAREELPRPFTASASAFVDFFFFVQSIPRTTPTTRVQTQLDKIWARLPGPMKVEHLMLRWLRRSTRCV